MLPGRQAPVVLKEWGCCDTCYPCWEAGMGREGLDC